MIRPMHGIFYIAALQSEGFRSLDEARKWVNEFVYWYNNERPKRSSKEERNWQHIGAVELNPEQHKEAA
ncbi:hypothetical protein MSP8887_00567 [Marinomonas spartinae]|nr:hypothetical protein MSP8887_00567 [Marinomonas spartinae]